MQIESRRLLERPVACRRRFRFARRREGKGRVTSRKNVVVSLGIRFLDPTPGVFRMNVKGKGLQEKAFGSAGKQKRELAGVLLACAEAALPLGWIGDSRLLIASIKYNINEFIVW
jgi:hypothetical protein